MSTLIRKNAWNQEGTFSNPDLLWYAKGVKEMKSRSVDDETSWWFFAGIHGDYLQNVSSGMNVSTTPIPSQTQRDMYWEQCQHSTWFFLPWHRGYLYALENILREIIVSKGGPEDWALPYWNYFGEDNQNEIPPAFTELRMPDGTENPLYVQERFGPYNNGNIYIPLSLWRINENCQRSESFEGAQSDSYGGAETGFLHSGGAGAGSIEYNPHNIVHGAIGGRRGFMSNPRTAGLDPVFYLHHCNIDRMWAVWNQDGRSNPTKLSWLSGPRATGDRKFYMPKPDKSAWNFTPEMVTNISQLNYSYDDIGLPIVAVQKNKTLARLEKFGFDPDKVQLIREMKDDLKTELIGASSGSLSLKPLGASASIKLDAGGWSRATESLNKLSSLENSDFIGRIDKPDEFYLQLDGIKGKEDSIVCEVLINERYVGHVSLFGLESATSSNGHHGGAGLTIKFDITDIVDDLELNKQIDISSMDIKIIPVNMLDGDDIKIDRVSVYRK